MEAKHAAIIIIFLIITFSLFLFPPQLGDISHIFLRSIAEFLTYPVPLIVVLILLFFVWKFGIFLGHSLLIPSIGLYKSIWRVEYDTGMWVLRGFGSKYFLPAKIASRVGNLIVVNVPARLIKDEELGGWKIEPTGADVETDIEIYKELRRCTEENAQLRAALAYYARYLAPPRPPEGEKK